MEIKKRDEEGNKGWRWYHGVVFYLVMQVLAFGLSALVSGLRRKRIGSIHKLFGDTAYFKSLKQVKITPPA